MPKTKNIGRRGMQKIEKQGVLKDSLNDMQKKMNGNFYTHKNFIDVCFYVTGVHKHRDEYVINVTWYLGKYLPKFPIGYEDTIIILEKDLKQYYQVKVS